MVGSFCFLYNCGRPIQQSTKTFDKEGAKRILKIKEGEIASGRYRGPSMDRVYFEDLPETDFLLIPAHAISLHLDTQVLDFMLKHLRTNNGISSNGVSSKWVALPPFRLTLLKR
jgi:hypothetical protein